MALDYTRIGMRIKSCRTEKHMTQEKLSEIADISTRYVRDIEAGAKSLSLEKLVIIANALNVSADDLLTDNLLHSSSTANTEIHDLLLDCSSDEKAILIKAVKLLKALLSEYGI